ncbi:Inner membrane protein YrbG, predicted calcium/sodium:proton antiporter [uncultured Candidatus Thioglobus sp.]|nr:Inner membrane protein YrbG, predicted calcium/sodium:proton antiporter [uncultured Candidatus Thioglobus sp.]
MLINYLGILLGLALLVYGANLFIDSVAQIASYFGLSTMLIGLVVVGIATSAPEILVGTVAALNGKTEIAIGNGIGSNIANISLVLGVTILLVPIVISTKEFLPEFLIMMCALGLALVVMVDQHLSQIDSVILLVGFVVVIFCMVYRAKKVVTPLPELAAIDSPKPLNFAKSNVLFFSGLMLLLGGAHVLVESAVVVAKHYGLSDLVIGLTIVAVGTSLPELATSITAVKKANAKIAVGNILGSNIFNMLLVIGIPGVIHATVFEKQVLFRDFPVLIFLTLLLGLMLFSHKQGRLSRFSGVILCCSFIAYQYYLFKG